MSSIIITAPHSLCFINIPYRNCDTTSFVASHDLVDQLKSNGFKVKYFPSNHYRSEIDLNRIISRDTDYRVNLSNNLSDAILLIDVHSFPRKGFGPDVHVVILDNVPGTFYGKKLYDIMRFHDISVAYIYGAEINDIVEEARNLNIPAIIIEYGEFISMDITNLINNSVIEWTKYLVH